MESVFHISNCTVANHVKFATCTLLGNALTWCNSHLKTVNYEATYGMTWKTLKKMMTNTYCPRELKLMCGRMFLEESNKVKKYVGGLPDMIQGSVMASKPNTMQEAIEFATELMDQKIRTFADRQAENKRKLDENTRNNQTQQQPFKKQNVAMAYTGNQRVVTFFECGVQGHYKRDFPKLKNKNRGNQAGNGNAQARAYAVDIDVTNPNSNVVMNHGYDVELADGKIIRVNTIIRGCSLNFLNHPFNIDLMPVELGSFDVIIGMESNKVKKYVGGLPDMIQGSVMASKPNTMQEAIEFATELMDQKIRTFADRQAENKRKLDENTRNNQTQQQPFKKQNVAMAYTVGPNDKKEYGGSLPLFLKCNYHHKG
uniref:Reverse transcriptase domain-containing protein n=1 Tax=Tanacetum cinerariifolium TaxID=118510 RepID=A0A699K9Y3_TANCI|nr:hypothetical protein [Tanacetum cinerariifolium]